MNETSHAPLKRLMLYHHFDRDNVIDPHVLYQLKAFHDFGIRIVFLTNSDLAQDELKKLDGLAEETILHGNHGFDFGAWQDWFRANEKTAAEPFDQLILMNCSCYGPLFPLDDLFAGMERKPCDFWGLTSYKTDEKYPEHVQSNFSCFLPQTFLSDVFWDYWKKDHDFSTFPKTIENGEVELSRTLTNAGFKSAAFCEIDNRQTSWQLSFVQSFNFYAPDYLIRRYRVPFLKIKGFLSSETLPFGKAGLIMNAIRDSGSSYPPHLIFDHLRRVQPLSWQKDLPKTLLVSRQDTPTVLKSSKMKIAAVIHVSSAALFEEQHEFLRNIPESCAFFFSVPNDADIEPIRKKMDGYNVKSIVAEPEDNHFSSWLKCFRNESNDYDLVLKLHTLNAGNVPELLPFELRNYLFSMLSGSKPQIGNIIEAFDSEPDLGILFPPIPPVLMMRNPHVFTQKHSDENLKILNACCNGHLPPAETGNPVFPAGGMFWYRSSALKSLIDNPYAPPTDLERILPYIAQANGYYYRLVISEDMLARSFQIFEDRLTSIYWNENDIQIERLNSKIHSLEQSFSWK